MSSNFEPGMWPALRAVLELAAASPRCAFYRDRGLAAPPANFEAFRREVRFLERRDLLSTPWRARLFVPEEEVGDFGVSSGTSEAGRPLIVPRLGPHARDMLRFTVPPAELSAHGVRRLMSLLPPFSGLGRNLPRLPLPGVSVLTGDPRAMDASALVAAETGVDGLVTTPTGLERLLDACARLDARLPLRWVSLGGEGLSRARLAWLRARLPGARIVLRYGSAETGPRRFYRCGAVERDPALFHAVPGSHLFEIVSEDGSPVPAGEPGELVHTDLELPSAFPFIRYRTGDGASVEGACACGAALLRLSGRIGWDSLRYAGIALTVEGVAEALRRLGGPAAGDFRLRLTEEDRDGRPAPRLRLALLAPRAVPPGPAREELARAVERSLPPLLRVSAGTTLAQLAADGRFLPLAVELVEAFPAVEGKPRRLSLDL